MDAVVELGRDPVSKRTTFSLSTEMSKLTRDGTAEPSRETKFSGANGDRNIHFPVQLTSSSRIGNLTRLIDTLAILHGHIHQRKYGPKNDTGGVLQQ